MKEQSIDRNEAVIFKTTERFDMLKWNLLFYRQTHQSETYFVVNVSINQSLSLEALKYLVSSQLWFSLLRTATIRKKSPAEMIEWFRDELSVRWNWINFSIFSSFFSPSLSTCLFIMFMYHQLLRTSFLHSNTKSVSTFSPWRPHGVIERSTFASFDF